MNLLYFSMSCVNSKVGFRVKSLELESLYQVKMCANLIGCKKETIYVLILVLCHSLSLSVLNGTLCIPCLGYLKTPHLLPDSFLA